MSSMLYSFLCFQNYRRLLFYNQKCVLISLFPFHANLCNKTFCYIVWFPYCSILIVYLFLYHFHFYLYLSKIVIYLLKIYFHCLVLLHHFQICYIEILALLLFYLVFMLSDVLIWFHKYSLDNPNKTANKKHWKTIN